MAPFRKPFINQASSHDHWRNVGLQDVKGQHASCTILCIVGIRILFILSVADAVRQQQEGCEVRQQDVQLFSCILGLNSASFGDQQTEASFERFRASVQIQCLGVNDFLGFFLLLGWLWCISETGVIKCSEKRGWFLKTKPNKPKTVTEMILQ